MAADAGESARGRTEDGRVATINPARGWPSDSQTEPRERTRPCKTTATRRLDRIHQDRLPPVADTAEVPRCGLCRWHPLERLAALEAKSAQLTQLQTARDEADFNCEMRGT